MNLVNTPVFLVGSERYEDVVANTKAQMERFCAFLGVELTFQETLSRCFGLNRIHRKAVSRINRIINANLK